MSDLSLPDAYEAEPAAPPLDTKVAARLMRDLRNIEDRLDQHTADYQQIVAENEEWDRSQRERLESQAADLRRQLTNFHLAQLAADPDGPKFTSLPTGIIESRVGSLVAEIEDPDAFLAWAQEHAPLLINQPPRPPAPAPKPDKQALLKLAKSKEGSIAANADLDVPGDIELVSKETGEKIPGAKLVRKDRTIKVETNR